MAKYSEQIDANRPFLGLKSYEEYHQSIFGGRNMEVSKLIKLIDKNTLTVVFGKSGIGKTSLLKAGLLPKLRRNFYLPIYVRVNFLSLDTPLDQIKNEIEHQVLERDGKAIRFEGLSLWEYFHQVTIMDGMLQPVLILDQFEELFTLGKPKSKQVNELIRELGDLAENRVPRDVQERNRKSQKTVSSEYAESNYKVMLSLREDYLPNLESMKKYMPSIKDSRFRVMQMNGEQAIQAIVKSGRGIIDESTAITLIKKIPKPVSDGLEHLEGNGDWKKAKVEPFLVSLVCYELNETRLSQGVPKITDRHVEGGDIKNAIFTHYDNSVVKKFDESLCVAIEELLVTAEGYRRLCIKSDFIEKFSIEQEAVDALVDTRIIRQETRSGVEYIELIHDVLAPLIKDRRDARRFKENKDRERAELRKELEERSEKARQAKKWLVIYRLAGIILLLAVVLSVFFGLKARVSEKAAEEAKKQLEAEKQKTEDNRDSINTKIAVMKAKEDAYAEMLDDANEREQDLLKQLKGLKEEAYVSFQYENYKKNLDVAKQLLENGDYRKAREYYNVASHYADQQEEGMPNEIAEDLTQIGEKISRNQNWLVDVFYLEDRKEETLLFAQEIAPLFQGQGYKVRIRMLSDEINAQEGYKINSNQIRINQDEQRIGRQLKSSMEEQGYKDFQLVQANSPTAKYCSVFIHNLPENKVITKKGSQFFKDGWIYVGEYNPIDNTWKTRYLDFSKSTEVNPENLEGQKASVREETGQLNVRKNKPDEYGQFGDVVEVLHSGTSVEIKAVESWGTTNYVWALASYRVD